jgi:hypothetical protein
VIGRTLLAAVAAVVIGFSQGVSAGAAVLSGSTQIARLVVATPVRSSPRSSSPLVAVLAPVRPLTRQQTALPVHGTHTDARRVRWLRVQLPGRPNGRSGWVRAAATHLSTSRWSLVIVRGLREAMLLRDGVVAERIPVVVGKPRTPTPAGRFFVVEHVRQVAGSHLGDWALATSAYSNVLQEFDGGPGQIALHGRRGPLAIAPLGTAASHGCIRFDNGTINRLARLLPNGTPIEIR